MMIKLKRWSWLGGLVMGCAVPGAAQVNYVGATWYSDQVQTSDLMPSDPPRAFFYATLAAATAGDVFGGQVEGPASAPLDFVEASYGAGTYLLTASSIFASDADLLTVYPGGKYRFRVTAGNALWGDQPLTVPTPEFAFQEPYLDGGTFSAMQAWASGTDAPLTWGGFTHSGVAPETYTTFYLFDYTKNTLEHIDVQPFSTTGTTVPSAKMLSGHYYGYELGYQTSTRYPAFGFGGAADAVTSTLRRVTGRLHVKSDPGTVAGQLTLGDSYVQAGVPVTAEVLDDDGTVLDTQTFTLGAYGYYAFDTTVTGVKRVRYRASHWLSQDVKNLDLDAGVDEAHLTLVNGDVDGDDSVTVFDYDRLSAAFDAVSGDPSWDPEADLDGDGTVTVFDYDVLSRNFDQSGATVGG